MQRVSCACSGDWSLPEHTDTLGGATGRQLMSAISVDLFEVRPLSVQRCQATPAIRVMTGGWGSRLLIMAHDSALEVRSHTRVLVSIN